MRVLMQGRYGLLSAKGGDRVQIENTADCLRSMGVSVDIVDSDVSDISSYDIVHVFQLDWTPETHFFVKHAKAQGKKVILSPIHHNIAEVKKFDDICVYDYRRISKYLFRDQHSRDTFKNVYRSIFTPKKLWPTMYSVFAGLKNMHIETLKMCDAVLVQTDLEASDLISTYDVDIKWVKVPNGVGEQFLQLGRFDNPFDFSDYIFCGGRIEPRKNQLNLIQAVANFRQENNLDTKLVLAGNPSTFNHLEYTYRFKKALVDNPWV
ncbi:hypothetical protein KAZ57_03105, partial [Patescibacteria group bacterium]|nr:hypothetical protein [Patescibacteria group bacterium]